MHIMLTKKEKIILRHVLMYQKFLGFFFIKSIITPKNTMCLLRQTLYLNIGAGKKEPHTVFFSVSKIQINCKRFGCSYYDQHGTTFIYRIALKAAAYVFVLWQPNRLQMYMAVQEGGDITHWRKIFAETCEKYVCKRTKCIKLIEAH